MKDARVVSQRMRKRDGVPLPIDDRDLCRVRAVGTRFGRCRGPGFFRELGEVLFGQKALVLGGAERRVALIFESFW